MALLSFRSPITREVKLTVLVMVIIFIPLTLTIM